MRKIAKSSGKQHSISYVALALGIICFFIVFIEPTRIANIGYLIGDYITFFFTGAGIILSIIGIVKSKKKTLSIISLILSTSFFVFWIVTIILLFTGQFQFAP